MFNPWHVHSPSHFSEVFELAKLLGLLWILDLTDFMVSWVETATSGVKSCSPLFFFRIRQSLELLFVERKGGIEYLIGLDLKKVPFVTEQGVTTELVPLEIRGLLPEAEGLAHHAGALGHGVVIDGNIERVDEVGKAGGILGLHELAFLKEKHFLINFLDE